MVSQTKVRCVEGVLQASVELLSSHFRLTSVSTLAGASNTAIEGFLPW